MVGLPIFTFRLDCSRQIIRAYEIPREVVAEAYRRNPRHRQNTVEAIRKVRDQKGDDRCWKDLEELYGVLPEGYESPVRDTLVELENCKKYIASHTRKSNQLRCAVL